MLPRIDLSYTLYRPGHNGFVAPSLAPFSGMTSNPIKETILNGDLDSGDWLNMVIWDDNKARNRPGCAPMNTRSQWPLDPDSIKVILDLNDPHMLFDAESVRESQQQLSPIKHAVKKGRKPNPRPIPKVSHDGLTFSFEEVNSYLPFYYRCHCYILASLTLAANSLKAALTYPTIGIMI